MPRREEIIAFTSIDISSNYAAKFHLASDYITILGKRMHVFVIANYEVSIRLCELKNFSRLLGMRIQMESESREYRNLMRYLTETGFTLVELIDFPEARYDYIKRQIVPANTDARFFNALDKCRELCLSSAPGHNVLRYLLFHLNNKIINRQRDLPNEKLSQLRLKYGCIPFDQMPFNSSLVQHNPKSSDLFECFGAKDRQHEILARYINNNVEIKGQLYTPVAELAQFGDIAQLIQTYNDTLYYKHTGRRIKQANGFTYIQDYHEDTLFIVKQLTEMAETGVTNYSAFAAAWLATPDNGTDSDEKRTMLSRLFEQSRVALIYGSAGTGKSYLINHISNMFVNNSKLYLANTNPAVDNLRRRVTAANTEFSTIAKYKERRNTQTEYDLLFIDECSMVSNRDMRAILEKTSFKLLILVGDVYQIESIRFGNWFSVAPSFIPASSVFELTEPYRTKDEALLTLWSRVRQMDDTLLEHITRKGYSVTLDASIFDFAGNDEIILCLNYDGLYGINNINRFLQEANPNRAFSWGVHCYKVGDPILFNESERFAPLIYNNMKGKIAGIEIRNDKIRFDIEIEKIITDIDASSYDFVLLDSASNGNSVIRFYVDKYRSEDDDENTSVGVVPFQVAYAVSIHKAQGLEYDSVKVVITDEVDELITHNIFYTAITRARKHLKIYWTPEVEKKVLGDIAPKRSSRDVQLLRNYIKKAAK